MNKDAIRRTIDLMSRDQDVLYQFDMYWPRVGGGPPRNLEGQVFAANEDNPDADEDANGAEHVRAGRILGLNEEQAERLFLITEPPSECWHPHIQHLGRENIPPERAIGTLVYLLEKGKVNWDAGEGYGPADIEDTSVRT